jgi:hypothetical protein
VSLYKYNLGSDKTLLFRQPYGSLEKVLDRANRKLQQSYNFINKIKSREVACINRAKSIPENATLRKEYIKCGKKIFKGMDLITMLTGKILRARS